MNRNSRQKLPKNRKVMITIIASVIVIAAILGVVLFTTGETSAYSQKLKLAEQYIAEGDLDAAEIQYKELINLDPKRETAYIDLAEKIYLVQFRYTEAYEILDLGQKNTGKDRTFEKAIKRVTDEQKNSEAWKNAYREVLQQNADGIAGYEYPEYGDPRKGTALCDLNGDGIDELLFFVAETFELETLHIYTFQDGNAREITYDWNGSDDITGAEPDSKMRILQAAGGADYIVYQEKGQKGFTTYSNITDEEIFCSTNRYEMDESCDANRTVLLGMHFDLVDFENNGKFGPDYATCYKDGKECSRDDYYGIMDPSIKNIETVIFRFSDDKETEDISYDDNPTLWKNTKGKAISITYDEMISKLQVAATEGQPAGGTLKDEDYPEKISGGLSKEETATVLAYATGMCHARDSGSEISREELENYFNDYYGTIITHYIELTDDYSIDENGCAIPLNHINQYRLFYGFEPYEKNATYNSNEGYRCWTDDGTLHIQPAWGDSFMRTSGDITEAGYSGDSLQIKYEYSVNDMIEDTTEQGTCIAHFTKTADGKYALNSIEEE